MEQDTKLVSCLLLADSSPHQTARAVLCYQRQTWQQKELIVIDNGLQNLSPLLEDIPETELQYIKVPPGTSDGFGSMKNRGLDEARGEFVIHWDPADWHHPGRIRHQLARFEEGVQINWLSTMLLHLDHPEFVHHPYRYHPKAGYTGSFMHVNDPSKRYPASHRKPDQAFLENWDASRVCQLDPDYSWLVIHGMKGDNRNRRRFQAGLRQRPGDAARLLWLKMRGRNRLAHPRFRLSLLEKESFQKYLQESRKLGALASIT
jgi:hypothetical protein